VREILMKRITKNIRTNLAVTEIVGTIIMLGIATSTMSVMYYQVVSAPTPDPVPIVEISGKIDDNNIIVTHQCGVPLDLDTELNLNIGGIQKSFKVRDFLDSKSKEDGVWGFSEKVVYPLEYDFDYSEYPTIDFNIFDKGSNSILMTGIKRVNPTCDLGITITVDNLNPKEYEKVIFTIIVTNYGNVNASGASIEFLLPEGLTYNSSTLAQGSYDKSTGIWDIGQLLKGESVNMIVIATVANICDSDPTQLAIILDGTDSITSANWTMVLKGISEAVRDRSRFPHNGNIELTIVQFGGFKPSSYARLEIGPIRVTENNVDTLYNDIQKIEQIGGKTPTSCAILMVADLLKASSFYDPDIRQIIMLVTDGNPTHGCNCDGDYEDDKITQIGPKVVAVVARDYLIELLSLDENEDSFNSISVEVTGAGHTYYLRDDIVWPQPGYSAPPFIDSTPNRGWVREIQSWQEFALSLNESFALIFNKIIVNANLLSTAFTDPKEVNDLSTIILKPIPEFASIVDEK
jgi:uncharacterized repeat protein (TIGR01451 family)